MSVFLKKAVVVIATMCIFSMIYERYEVTAFMMISQLGLMAGVYLVNK